MNIRHIYSLALLAISFLHLPLKAAAQDFEILSVTAEATDCFDTNTGSITIVVSGGEPNYRYAYFNTNTFESANVVSSETEHTFSGLSRGIYNIWVNYDNSGEDPLTTVAQVASPPLLFAGIMPDPAVTCANTLIGLDGNPAGGTGTYLHDWSGDGAAFLDNPNSRTPVFGAPAAGSYSLTYTVVDDNNCIASDDIVVTVYAALEGTPVVTAHVLCHGENTGEITVTAPSGGSGSYEYSLDGSSWQSATLFSNLPAGFYDVFMRDVSVSICEEQIAANIQVTQPAEPVSGAVTGLDDVSCHGGSDGSFTVEGGGGTPGYEYRLDGGEWQGSGNFDELPAGDYTVRVRDTNLCFTDVPVTVSEPDTPVSGSVTALEDVSCHGSSDGSFTVEGGGGTPGYEYSLDGGAFVASGSFGSLEAGSYTVRVRDANLCFADVPVTLSEPDEPLAISVDAIGHIDCHGDANGTISLSASGGTAPYMFRIDGGAWQDNGDFGPLNGGTYIVAVDDAGGCGPVTVEVTVNEPDEITITDLSYSDIECHGLGNGQITVTASGGTGTLTYTLLPDGISNTSGFFGDLSAGTYEVLVDDENFCGPAATGDIVISEPDELEISPDLLVHNLCHGDELGEIRVSSSGGTGTVTFTLEPGDVSNTSGVFGLLPAGTYRVSADDEGGCGPVWTDDIVVDQPDLFEISVSYENVSCFGEADGEISVTAAGGVSPYEYSITGDDPAGYQASGDFSLLPPGGYEVIARDDNMCLSNMVEVEINEPAQVFVGFDAPAIETCYGDPGKITLSASGGSGSFEYSITTTQWVPGTWRTNNVFDDLEGGVAYYAFVRDTETECITYVNAGNSITISQPTEISYSVTSVQHVTGCFYNNDGEIRISSPTGGSSPYSYFINGTQNPDRIFRDLTAGNHLVEVVDNRGCRIPETVTITAPDEIVVDDVALTPVTGCHDNTNGAISLLASGGTGVLEYALNGGPFVAPGDFDNLPGGGHTIIIRDENMCILEVTYTLDAPGELLPPDIQTVPASCGGADDAAIRARASGGTPPYTVSLWLGGTELSERTGIADGEWVTFGGLQAGVDGFTVHVDDSEGCGPAVSAELQTTGPPPLTAGPAVTTGNTCYGDAEGSVEIEARGGTAPYTYTLFDSDGNEVDSHAGEGGAFFGGLPGGTYSVAVDDANLCGPVVVDDIVIDEPGQLVVSVPVVTGVSCHGSDDGSITVTASGGTGDLEYSADGGAEFFSSGFFVGLPAGTYHVIVRDQEGCEVDAGEVEVTQPDELAFTMLEIRDIIIGSGIDNGSVTVGVEGGTPPYMYSADGGATWQDEEIFSGLSEGEYEIVVADENGCSIDTVAVVAEVIGIDAQVSLTHPLCHGSANGVISIAASLGTEPYEYSIDDGASFFDQGIFVGLTAGTYHIVVRDASGYIYRETAELIDPAGLEATVTVTDAWCSSLSADGSVVLEVTGGTGSYSYLWDDGSEEAFASGLQPGEYHVLVYDENDCELYVDVTVGYTHLLEVSLPAGVTVCHGEEYELVPSLVQSGSSVVWTWTASEGPDPGPVARPVVAPVTPVLYRVSVSDENGCMAEDEVLVELHPLQGIFIGNDTVVMQGTQLNLEATGGEFVSYEWAPPTGLSVLSGPATVATVNAEVTYYVFAETAEGCTESASIHIDVLLPIEPVSGFTPNDDGINDYFDIVNASDYPDIEVEVFNRSGQRVFYSRGYTDDRRWDGTYNGRELPVGTYYYVITLNDGFGTRPVTGPVTIVR